MDLFLPFYHTISDVELPHIKNLYQVKTTKQFINDLDELLNLFEPISFQDLLQNKTTQKPAILLSFDDGLTEIYHTIAPILKSKGIPAITFLNSDFLDNRALFFRYKVSLIIEFLNTENSKNISEMLSCANKQQTIKKALLCLQHSDTALIDSIAKNMELSFDDFLTNQQPYLTTEQINHLIDQGFEFGAHSCSHPEYRFISEEQQLQQTVDSIEFIRSKFNLNYSAFSFPFTDYDVSQSFFEQLHKKTKIDLTFGCAGIKEDSTKKHHQRFALENNNHSSLEVLKSELFYYSLLKTIGKHRIER